MPSLVLNGAKISVHRDHRRLILSRDEDDAEKHRTLSVPLADVDRATIIGHPVVPITVLQRLMTEKIPVSFISEKGRWFGTLHPDGDRNVARRLLQYEQQKNIPVRLTIAQQLIAIKIRNQRRVLQRLAANRNESNTLEQKNALLELKQYTRAATYALSLDGLRGIEGAASARYFSRLTAFFPESVPFEHRSRRPPHNAANALLSWTYTIVLSEIEVAIKTQGLDPCLGWLHEISSGSPSLALDLIEPLRAPVCDMLALNLLNHQILQPKHFHISADDGGTYLNEDARRIFFIHYENHMQRKFKPAPNANHIDLRQAITQQIWGVLRLLENPEAEENGFFEMQ